MGQIQHSTERISSLEKNEHGRLRPLKIFCLRVHAAVQHRPNGQ